MANLSNDVRKLPVRRELLILGAIGLAFAVLCIWLIGRGAPLGHDEAVYALKARTMADGSTSAYFWNDYRAPGLPFALSLVGRVAVSDALLRLAVACFGGLLIVLTWIIARELFDPVVGLIAAAGVALSPVVLASSTAVWPDIPGAAVGLAALAVLVLSVRRDRVSWWVLTAAPLTVMATLIRFGAPLPIGIGAAAIAVWRWSTVRRSIPQVVALGIATALGVLAVLAVPDVLGTATSPLESLGKLTDSNDLPIYQGLIDYAQLYDFLFLTPTGLMIMLGITWGSITARRTPENRTTFVLAAGVGTATALGIAVTLHGEYRYLAPALPWLWIAGAVGLARGSEQIRRDLLIPMLGLALAGAVLAGVADGDIEVTKAKERFLELRTASRQIDDATTDGSCGVVTGYIPQVAWYSHCVTTSFSATEVRLTSGSFPANATVYVFLVQDGKRQPEGELLAKYLGAADGGCISVGEPADGPLRYVEACLVGDG